MQQTLGSPRVNHVNISTPQQYRMKLINSQKMTDECQSCRGKTKTLSSRLTKDTCGHCEKCRMSLLGEDQGCKACSQMKKPGSPDKRIAAKLLKSPKQNPPESISLPKKPENNSQSQVSTLPKKLEEPPDRSHIVKFSDYPERYKCNSCSKEFHKKEDMHHHDGCPFGIPPYRCKICGKTLKNKQIYTYHELTHTGHKPFKCELCPGAYYRKSHLNQHKKIHYNKKEYLCSKCDKTYAKKGELKIHMMLHKGAYLCLTCGKCLNKKKTFDQHMQTHSTDRSYICECLKSFKDESLLIEHRKSHRKEQLYSCAHCRKVFLLKTDLKRHIQTHIDDGDAGIA